MNHSRKNIIVAGSFSYPDTVIKLRVNDIIDSNSIINTNESNSHALWGRGCKEDLFLFDDSYDTIMIFIFDAHVVDTNLWDDVINDYKVLQRYDLSLQNVRLLDWQLSYPPTKAMKSMKMYPPYNGDE
jgi:hypothetical protein